MLAAPCPPRAPSSLAHTTWGPAWDLGPLLLGRGLPWGPWQGRQVWGAPSPPSTGKPTVEATKAAAGARGPCQVFGGIGTLRALVLMCPPPPRGRAAGVPCSLLGGIPARRPRPAFPIVAPSDCRNHLARLRRRHLGKQPACGSRWQPGGCPQAAPARCAPSPGAARPLGAAPPSQVRGPGQHGCPLFHGHCKVTGDRSFRASGRQRALAGPRRWV